MTPSIRSTFFFLPLILGLFASAGALREDNAAAVPPGESKGIQIQYLEIVTPDLDATCDALAKMHGVEFSDPVMEFGGARTANLAGGGILGVRKPMRETELPVVRPYVLVENIDQVMETVKEAGAEIAMPPMPIPGRGKFAIYILGGIQHGIWQL